MTGLARGCIGLLGLALAGCDAAPADRQPPPATRASGHHRLFIATAARQTLPPDLRSAGVRSLLRTSGRMRYGEFVWDEAEARPSGPVMVRVDLARQLLSVFRGGDEIGTAVILYGADSRPTPRGRFPVLARFQDHRSSRYDAPMAYTLRLTGDGVSIHGSNVREGYATHGCIGVPLPFARRLFAIVRRGDPVVIV